MWSGRKDPELIPNLWHIPSPMSTIACVRPEPPEIYLPGLEICHPRGSELDDSFEHKPYLILRKKEGRKSLFCYFYKFIQKGYSKVLLICYSLNCHIEILMTTTNDNEMRLIHRMATPNRKKTHRSPVRRPVLAVLISLNCCFCSLPAFAAGAVATLKRIRITRPQSLMSFTSMACYSSSFICTLRRRWARNRISFLENFISVPHAKYYIPLLLVLILIALKVCEATLAKVTFFIFFTLLNSLCGRNTVYRGLIFKHITSQEMQWQRSSASSILVPLHVTIAGHSQVKMQQIRCCC